MGWQDGNSLPQPYQSIGSLAVNAFVGRATGEQYPADRPHFIMDLTPEALFDPTLPAEVKHAFREKLAADSQKVMLALEQAGNAKAGPTGMGFYATKQQSLAQIAVAGNVCERLNPDLSITGFRLDNYVVRRDGAGRVVHVITREQVDPLSLSDEQIAKLGTTRAECCEQPSHVRMKTLYTSCCWEYDKGQWELCQEIDKVEIHCSYHKYSPYTVVALALAPGDSYGRGLIELAFGDLSTYDKLCQYVIEAAGMASKLVPCIDPNSTTRPQELAKPSGEVVITPVKEGQVKDIAFLKVDKGGDMSFVLKAMETIEARLGRALMLLSESVRQSERTTAYEVSAVTIQQQQESMLSVFASVADQLDGPQIQAAIEMCYRKGIIDRPSAETAKGIQIVLLTGQTALAAQARTGKMLALVQLETQMGEQPGTYIDRGVAYRAIARMQRVDEPGLVKTEQQVAAAAQAAIAQQLQLAAGQQAIQSSGAIAEQAAAAAIQPKG